MNDSEFKKLEHPVGTDFEIVSTGQEVFKGYKPDVTIRGKTSDTLKFILESEQKTDRKAFLGDLLKAEMYAEKLAAKPELIIVMRPFSNTTTQQIAEHLRPYKDWLTLKKDGQLSLSAVQVMSDEDYKQAIADREILGSEAFKRRGHLV